MVNISSFKKFQNDDIKLILEVPDDYLKYTDLSKEQIESDFEAFASVLFDNILTKDKRNFRIIFDEETQTHDIIFPVK